MFYTYCVTTTSKTPAGINQAVADLRKLIYLNTPPCSLPLYRGIPYAETPFSQDSTLMQTSNSWEEQLSVIEEEATITIRTRVAFISCTTTTGEI